MNKQEILQRKEYEFLRKMIDDDEILLLTLTGSHSYGTNVEDSDIDIRGIMKTPKATLLGLESCFGYDDAQETGNTDTVLYTTNHFFEKLRTNNPAFIEILATREEDILYISEVGRMIKDNLGLFLTQNIFYSFEGYALSLLNRLQNHLGGVEKDEDIDKRMIERFELMKYYFNDKYKSFDNSSMKIKENNGDLLIDIFLKDYSLDYLFKLLEEFKNMSNDYEKKKKSVGRRNKKKTQSKLDKHVMYLFRLLFMAIELGKTGQVSTYRPQKEREFLLEVRKGLFFENGKLKDCFFEKLEESKEKLKEVKKDTVLPKKQNWETLNAFVQEVNFLTLK